MRTRAINAEEHARIADAIRAAEAETDGEIYCVVAHSSDSYFFPAAFMAMVGMLVASLVIACGMEMLWLSLRLSWFVALQILAALCVVAVLWLAPALRIHLVPHGQRHKAAHANAVRQFLARNVHLTRARTGVLIFVSLAERYAEVVADSGISEHVGQHVWDGVVRDLTAEAAADRLAEGFVAAIGTVGAVLAQHFPVSSDDINELDDHLVEI
jgi:putative membrane protein